METWERGFEEGMVPTAAKVAAQGVEKVKFQDP